MPWNGTYKPNPLEPQGLYRGVVINVQRAALVNLGERGVPVCATHIKQGYMSTEINPLSRFQTLSFVASCISLMLIFYLLVAPSLHRQFFPFIHSDSVCCWVLKVIHLWPSEDKDFGTQWFERRPGCSHPEGSEERTTAGDHGCPSWSCRLKKHEMFWVIVYNI